MIWSPIVRTAPLFGLALLLVAAGAEAQEASARGQDDPLMQGRLIERFLDMATTQLNLTVEQREGLNRVLREAAERRSALGRGQRELQGAIQHALADPATPEEQFAQLSQRMLELQREGHQLQVWQRERLAEILTPRQVLRFMLLQEHLVRRIEEMRENRQQ